MTAVPSDGGTDPCRSLDEHDDGGRAAIPGVVVIVGGDDALPGAHWAAELCRRSGADLHLVQIAGSAVRHRDGAAADSLRRIKTALTDGEDLRILTRAVTGSPAPALLELSTRSRLIVLAEPKSADGGPVPENVAWTVASRGQCPLVIWRASAGVGATAPVVVGVDGSSTSASALEFAAAEAAGRGVALVVVMAWSDVFLDTDRHLLGIVTDWKQTAEGYRRLLAEQVAGLQGRFPDLVVERVLTQDRPVRALLREAARAQLLVVGTHGRGGFPGMLVGSVSRALIDHAPCPLAVVRPPRPTRTKAEQ